MKKICVVTGGGSGMGLSTAKLMAKDHHVILVGRTVAKLENALAEIAAAGGTAEAFPCDISKRASVTKLAEYSKSLGEINAVIHAAGISPNMGNWESIFTINAIGTIYMNEEFAKVMTTDSCILNVSSMSAYMLPEENVPKPAYKLSLSDSEAFLAAMNGILSKIPQDDACGSAYTFSKNFVRWYSEKTACKYGKQGIRVLSVSPGTFSTPMGDLEGEQAAAFARMGALGRVGNPDEIGTLMAFLASENGSYISGVDILCDGGTIAAMHTKAEGIE